ARRQKSKTRMYGVLNARASSIARSRSSFCCSYVKSAPNSGFFGLNGDFGAPGQSVLKTGEAISETRSLKRSRTPRASATSCASQFMMFLPCIARSSTYPRPNSRAATSHARPKTCEISSVRTDRVKVAMLFQVALGDQRRIFRRPSLVGHAVQLDHRPAAELYVVERGKNARQIHFPSPKLHEAVGRAVPLYSFHILQVQEQQPVRVATDRTDRIAAALMVMRHVELEPHVSWIGRVQNPIDVVGLLADRSHVIVVAERHADIRGSLADLGEQL